MRILLLFFVCILGCSSVDYSPEYERVPIADFDTLWVVDCIDDPDCE